VCLRALPTAAAGGPGGLPPQLLQLVAQRSDDVLRGPASRLLDRGVDAVLDLRGNVAVEDGLGPALGVLKALLEDRQVGELLQQIGVLVERPEDRCECLSFQLVAFGVLADPPLDELQSGGLVLRRLGDGAVVSAQGRNEGLAVDARQGGDVELLHPQGVLAVGVLIGPLAVEDEVALLEGVTAVLLLPLQGLLGDVTLGEAVDKPLQPRDRLAGVEDDLVVVVEAAAGGVDEFRGAAGQPLVLGELPAEATNVLMTGQRPHRVDGGLDLLPGRGDRDSGLGQEVLAVEHDRRIGDEGDREELVLIDARLPHGLKDVVVLELVLGQLDHPPVGGELGDPDVVQ